MRDARICSNLRSSILGHRRAILRRGFPEIQVQRGGPSVFARASAARAQRPAPRGGRPIRRGQGRYFLRLRRAACAPRIWRAARKLRNGNELCTLLTVIHNNSQREEEAKRERTGRQRLSSSLPTTTAQQTKQRRRTQNPRKTLTTFQAPFWIRKCCPPGGTFSIMPG